MNFSFTAKRDSVFDSTKDCLPQEGRTPLKALHEIPVKKKRAEMDIFFFKKKAIVELIKNRDNDWILFHHSIFFNLTWIFLDYKMPRIDWKSRISGLSQTVRGGKNGRLHRKTMGEDRCNICRSFGVLWKLLCHVNSKILFLSLHCVLKYIVWQIAQNPENAHNF